MHIKRDVLGRAEIVGEGAFIGDETTISTDEAQFNQAIAMAEQAAKLGDLAAALKAYKDASWFAGTTIARQKLVPGHRDSLFVNLDLTMNNIIKKFTS